jgi:hypothetical protein
MTANAERFARLRRELLLLLLTAGAAVLFAGAGLAQRPHDGAGSASTEPRSFDHRRHENLACSACHGTGERHRTLLIRTQQDCLACHHDAARANPCTTCHDRDLLPEPDGVQVALALSVWETPRRRELRFGHQLHADVDCRACHSTPVTLAMDRTCGTCHVEHHSPAADCRSCHATPPTAAHTRSAHLTCSGGGCHAPQSAPAPALSRTLCVACHEAQRTHEPDGECAACHRIPHNVNADTVRIPARVAPPATAGGVRS